MNSSFLQNLGSAPLGIAAIQRRIDDGTISVHNLSSGDLHILEDIRCLDRGAEYIYALSASRGMRIFAKSPFYRSMKVEEFHHQNIYQNNMDLVAVGTIHNHQGRLIFTNMSGHYRPPSTCLHGVDSYLQQMGISRHKYRVVEYSRIDILSVKRWQRLVDIFTACIRPNTAV